jgi:hypothetical protein
MKASGVMSTALVTAIRESCGYLQDEGWHQTAQLMALAASEIERLSERVQGLEAEKAREVPAHAPSRTAEALGRYGARLALVARRPRS